MLACLQHLSSVPWGAHGPVATLQHAANLQARFPSVKEPRALSAAAPSNCCTRLQHLLTVRTRSHPPVDGSALCVPIS